MLHQYARILLSNITEKDLPTVG